MIVDVIPLERIEPAEQTNYSMAYHEHPRALLFFAKVAVAGYALYLCAYGTWIYIPIHRVMALFSVIVLLPKFGWVLPATLAGVLASLSLPKHVNWDPSDDFGTIATQTMIAFVLGCLFDWISNRQSTGASLAKTPESFNDPTTNAG